MISSAASGAADFPTSANKTKGRRRPSPGQNPRQTGLKTHRQALLIIRCVEDRRKGIKGRDGEQFVRGARVVRVRGAAAVHGAETDAVWETEERTHRAPPPGTRCFSGFCSQSSSSITSTRD